MSTSEHQNIVLPEEIDYFVRSLRRFQVSEIGNKLWFDNHEMLLKLHQQTIIEASAYREEVVKELLIRHQKLDTLVHEIFCILVWRLKVLPKLLEIDPNPKATFIIYTILFHEATAIGLLEIILFHQNGCEALGESVLDLIDYCAQAITQLIGLMNVGHHEAERKRAIDQSTLEELDNQKRNLDYKIGMRCLTILNYLVHKIDVLPLSSINRLVQLHDVPCLLSEILHSKPWMRRVKGFQKFINDKWVPIEGDSIQKVTKIEAQTWFCFRQLLFNERAMQSYQINEFRQRELAKCQGLLNEILLDQLPPLAELKHFLCTFTVSGNESSKNQRLLLEELPEIKDNIMQEAQKLGYKKIASDQASIILISEECEILRIAKKLNEVYNADLFAEMESKNEDILEKKDNFFCGNCQKAATKKCSKCEQVYYCSRECQVKNWPNHKSICKQVS